MANGNGDGDSFFEIPPKRRPTDGLKPPEGVGAPEQDPGEQALGRRKLLLGAGAIVTACGALGYAMWLPVSKALRSAALRRRSYTKNGEIINPPVTAGAIELPFADYPLLRSSRTPYSIRLSPDYQPHRILIWREPGRSGRIRAISQTCTHRSCPIEMKGGERLGFFCPCHGSEFGPQGEALKGPASAPLPKLDVEVSGRSVRLRVSSRGSA